MAKSIKAMSPDHKHTINKHIDKKEKYRKILEKYGIPSPRLGGYEYMVATNLMVLEQLKKMAKEDISMLDF